MTIYHTCLHKAKIVWERTGVLVGHDEISVMCEMLNSADSGEFMDAIGKMTNGELKEFTEKAIEELKRRRKKRKIAEDYLAQERRLYA